MAYSKGVCKLCACCALFFFPNSAHMLLLQALAAAHTGASTHSQRAGCTCFPYPPPHTTPSPPPPTHRHQQHPPQPTREVGTVAQQALSLVEDAIENDVAQVGGTHLRRSTAQHSMMQQADGWKGGRAQERGKALPKTRVRGHAAHFKWGGSTCRGQYAQLVTGPSRCRPPCPA